MCRFEAAAAKRGIALGKSELIGLVPRDALDDAIASYLGLDKTAAWVR